MSGLHHQSVGVSLVSSILLVMGRLLPNSCRWLARVGGNRCHLISLSLGWGAALPGASRTYLSSTASTSGISSPPFPTSALFLATLSRRYPGDLSHGVCSRWQRLLLKLQVGLYLGWDCNTCQYWRNRVNDLGLRDD